jgi:dipeptidyl aminopeptidase/acylaminoacyl peptidase
MKEVFARWSPEGMKIAFTEDFFRRMQDTDIHVIDIETGTQVNLTNDGEWMIRFFPMIAYNRGGPAVPAFVLYDIRNGKEHSSLEDETAVINNAVFSPDGSKVLVVYGSRNEQRRIIAVRNIGNPGVKALYPIDEATAGISPAISGTTGVVGLDWCDDDTLFVATEMGNKALILKQIPD